MFIYFLISKLKKKIYPYMECFFSFSQLQTYFASSFQKLHSKQKENETVILCSVLFSELRFM